MPAQNLVYLFAAYAIIWIVLFGYTFYLSQQIGDLRAQVQVLLRRRGSGSSDSEPKGS